MAEEEKKKRYFWLKLKRDFFKRHDIRIIEDMDNGKDYILFYLKLLVESVDHEGNLRFSDTIPYNDKMLATVTNTNIDIVRAALNIFTELKMIDVLDDATIYMTQVKHMIGSETEWAEKKRLQREKKARDLPEEGQCPQIVLDVSSNCPTEIETDSDINSETDSNTELKTEINDSSEEDISSSLSHSGHGKQEIYDEIIRHWNTLPDIVPRLTRISNKGDRKRLLDARIKDYGIEAIHQAIEEIPKSKFLLGQGNRGWTIRFDWFIKPNNFPKVLEGNYRGEIKTQSTGNAYVDAVNSRMDVVANFLNGGNQN